MDIVIGTTYLVYMKEISSRSREGMSLIIGWQTGLREISAESGIEFEDINQIKAYNNYTVIGNHLVSSFQSNVLPKAAQSFVGLGDLKKVEGKSILIFNHLALKYNDLYLNYGVEKSLMIRFLRRQ